MEKIKIELGEVVQKIEEFYHPNKHHFLTLNGVALSENETEIQWIFSYYGQSSSTTIFYTVVKNSEIIPSITHIIPSAIISQREIVDMFAITVENSEKGLYLDEDSLKAPLSLGCVL